jgi:hypothetical protein
VYSRPASLSCEACAGGVQVAEKGKEDGKRTGGGRIEGRKDVRIERKKEGRREGGKQGKNEPGTNAFPAGRPLSSRREAMPAEYKGISRITQE